MIGTLWWSRLVNSVRFLDDIQDALMEGKSVVLHFENEIPWQDIMTETLSQRLSALTDSRTFEVHDAPDMKDPGTYLLEHFCSESERKKYWPTTHGSYERFLAINPETPLNNRYVCVTGIHSGNAAEWISSVTEYLENCNPSEEHGLFILLVTGTGTMPSGFLEDFYYEKYVSDYDCMMLCLTLISSLSCSRTEKMYLCEVASSIAHNHVELAGLLASEGSDDLILLKDPFAAAQSIYQSNDIKVTHLEDIVTTAVWESQIKLVFPKMESFRSAFIRKYEHRLNDFLPMKGANNEKIEKASDLEIGQLFHLCKENKSRRITEQSDYDMLKKMRDARNTLAHLLTLSYEQLKALDIF